MTQQTNQMGDGLTSKRRSFKEALWIIDLNKKSYSELCKLQDMIFEMKQELDSFHGLISAHIINGKYLKEVEN